jgi:hypothetical protein
MAGTSSPESHLTRLQGVTADGDLLLVTEDQAVQEKALLAGSEVRSFVYWTGAENEIVNGRVMAVMPTVPFQFTVRPEAADEGP